MSNLKKQLIRLGYEQPDLRKHLSPILDNLRFASTPSLQHIAEILREEGFDVRDPLDSYNDMSASYYQDHFLAEGGGITSRGTFSDAIGNRRYLDEVELIFIQAQVMGEETYSGREHHVVKMQYGMPWISIASEYLFGFDEMGDVSTPATLSTLENNSQFQSLVSAALNTGSVDIDRSMHSGVAKELQSGALTVLDRDEMNVEWDWRFGRTQSSLESQGLTFTWEVLIPKS